jgi:uncharacterized membrane protein
MGKGRLEAFSDGVLAIIITIMVLELKVPHEAELSSLQPLFPVFISYLLSFIYIGIYWNNHHHMLHAVQRVNGKVLWANMHLLFWLSLVPFATAWLGENHFSQWPVILYGFVLLMAGTAYYILSQTLIHMHGMNTALAAAIGNDRKGKFSLVTYVFAIILSFVHAWISMALYAFVAMIWVIPDTRIERKLENEETQKN